MPGGDRIEIYEGSDESEAEPLRDEDDVAPKMEEVESLPTVKFTLPPRTDRQKKKKVKRLTRREMLTKQTEKQERDKRGMKKPDIVLDREKERQLKRIALQGVVQLFNAVAERQKTVSKALETKSKDKKLLSGSNFAVNGNSRKQRDRLKDENGDDDEPSIKSEFVDFD